MEKNMDYKKNDIVTIEIQDISHDGEGIGKINGYPFFVKDTVIGDRAQIRVTKVKRNYAYGRLERCWSHLPAVFSLSALFTGSAAAVRSRPWLTKLSFGSRNPRSGII